MSDDWKVGDVAVCINRRPWLKPGPSFGDIVRVRRVGIDAGGRLGLHFAGWPGEGKADGFVAWCFRKLNDEPDNASVIRAIKNCKPAKQGEPA